MKDCCTKEKSKRDIFRFTGSKETAINLEHVTSIEHEECKISFSFYTNVIFIELPSADEAKAIFEQIMKNWTGDEVNPS